MRLIQKVGDWFDLRLQLENADSRKRLGTRFPAKTASWFLCLSAALAPHVFHAPTRDRHLCLR